MLRAAGYVVLAALVLLLAWWIGGLPGDVSAQVGPYTVQSSAAAGLFVVLLAAVLATITLRVVGGVWGVPGHVLAWHGARRARLGEVATQRALVALAAGDAKAAGTEAGRAKKLLGESPLVLLLLAESARLAGRADDAAAYFRQLSAHKEMGFLGHHGLLRAALESQDNEAASAHAAAAEAAYPGAAATRAHRLDLALREKNYRAALGLTQDKAQIAALATACAQAATTPNVAVDYAKRAVKAAPDFAPGIAALGRALRADGHPRAARATLLKAWRAAPHPVLAEAWLDGTPDALARARAAEDLATANPGHVESELMLAATARAAGLSGEAQRHDDAARAKGATAAPRLWSCTACHAPTPDWAPVCPSCGKLATLVLPSTGVALATLS